MKRTYPSLRSWQSSVLTLIASLTISSVSAATYYDEVQAANPVAWFRLNETATTSLSNSGSQSSTGMTSTGGPQLGIPSVSPGLQTAAGFDGSGQYLATGNSAGNAFIGQQPLETTYTIEAWVKLDSDWNTAGAIYSEYNPVGGQFFGLTAGRNPTFLGQTASSVTIDTEEWTYLVLKGGGYSGYGSNIAFYVNGVQVGDPNYYSPLMFNAQAATISAIGVANIYDVGIDSGVLQNFFNGVIDEVAIYNYSLTDETILAHYAAGVVPEPSVILLLGAAGLCVAFRAVRSARRLRN